MGKLTYVNMMEQLRAIHDSASKEDAKVKIEGSYSDDKEETRERDVFYSNSSKRGNGISLLTANCENDRGFYNRGSSYNTRRET